jgi:peptidoglycan LD-endopeptidase CwlK
MSLHHGERLDGCDPDLVRLVNAVARDRDIVVVQGARTVAEEEAAIASGHSALKNPMNSKHVVDAETRPLALAVDIAPLPLDWNDTAAFQALGLFVKATAAELEIGLIWGGDWVHLKDLDHFELVHPHPEPAI